MTIESDSMLLIKNYKWYHKDPLKDKRSDPSDQRYQGAGRLFFAHCYREANYFAKLHCYFGENQKK